MEEQVAEAVEQSASESAEEQVAESVDQVVEESAEEEVASRLIRWLKSLPKNRC